MERSDSPLFAAMVAVTSGLELAATLERIVQAAVDLSGARYCALGVVGPSGALDQFIQIGFDEATVAGIGTLPSGRGVLGVMVDQPVALRLDDISAHSKSYGFPPGHPPMTTFLGVPVRVRGEVFGNLYLTEKEGGLPFTEDDERAVATLAAAAGVAIENARLYERTRARERWQRAVTEIDNAVLAGAGPDVVLGILAGRARRLAGAQLALVCLPSDADLVISVVDSAADRDRYASLEGTRVPESSLAAEAFRSGHVTTGEVLVLGAPESGTVVDEAVMVLPLRTPERVLGVLVLAGADQLRMFTTDALELAEAFAAQAAVTLILAETREERERLAVFEDRDRIGRDLHDLVIQRLFATGIGLQRIARQEGLPHEVVGRIEKTVDELDETVREIRQTIFALQHSDSDQRGVRARVLAEASAATATLGFTPSTHFAGTVDALVPDATADQLMAALREGLSNAARHANADSVSIAVVVNGSIVELTVADDGIGIAEGGRRSGLANLAARAQELGGGFTIETRPGGGTMLRWWAPVD